MKLKIYTFILTLLFMSCTNTETKMIGFEEYALGEIPTSWESSYSWEIQKDDNNKVLSMMSNSKGVFGSNNGFNIFFNNDISFQDGKISVKFKSHGGNIDQGGGIMYRVIDKDNYYVARFNPLEDNFRFYKVIKANRTQLKSANIKLKDGWNSMSIIQKGNKFTGYLNDEKLLEVTDDSITQSGAVGVWSKADAQTSFSDLKITL